MSASDPPEWPVYAKKAKIIGGPMLYGKLPDGVTVDSLAEIAGCHPNTLRTALEGRRVQYVKAHSVFTALNVVARNGFQRVDHVQYFHDKTGELLSDPALQTCAVLYRAPDLLRKAGLKIDAVTDRAGIPFLEASVVLQSLKPVPREIVVKVFNVFHALNEALVDRDEIIG